MKKFLGKAVLSAVLASVLPQVAHARFLNPVVDRTAPPMADYQSGRLPFAITLRDDLVVDLATFAVFAEPGEEIRIRGDRPLNWIADGIRRPATTELDWTAPATAGLTRIQLEDDDGNIMQLNLVVMRRHGCLLYTS